ncbi:2-oxo-tetronate isomerase [uncultured Cohaesibacter sp.]|uniref:2-oxo-tetronate isomerase n=1 Tax=uncultured Cohaesibacter sp. TaxID=1002546 RepID=UPI0029C6A430|nr:2-oxo-tetronate isomerase [uncultured Cohaesibacter sp.]
MPRFAANLSMMYNEVPFMERFARAAADGFVGVEYLFPYDFEAEKIKEQLNENGLCQALFNAPPGDWAKGERGIASLPGREKEFRASIEKALHYAKVLDCKTIHIMSGNRVPLMLRDHQLSILKNNIALACDMALQGGVTIVLEPINLRSMPEYFLNRQDEAQAIVRELNRTNLAVQFDFFHCQIGEGDVTTRLMRDLPTIGHIQIASVPERHEPDAGELNYPWIFEKLDQIGYGGWVGCEYIPAGETSAGLGWFAPWKAGQKR